MIKRSRKKIEELRRQPEEARLKAALTMAAIIGLAAAIISLAVLLPLQVYLTRLSLEETLPAEQSIPRVGGASDQATK